MRRVSRGSSVSPSSAGGWGASRAGSDRITPIGPPYGRRAHRRWRMGRAVAQAGGNVSGPGIVLAIAMSMLVAWTWQLGTMLAPGMARPVDIFALPGISSGAWSPIPPGLAPRRTARPASGAESPTRFDIQELARRTGLTLEELRAAQPAYRRVTVPKRSGGEPPPAGSRRPRRRPSSGGCSSASWHASRSIQARTASNVSLDREQRHAARGACRRRAHGRHRVLRLDLRTPHPPPVPRSWLGRRDRRAAHAASPHTMVASRPELPPARASRTS